MRLINKSGNTWHPIGRSAIYILAMVFSDVKSLFSKLQNKEHFKKVFYLPEKGGGAGTELSKKITDKNGVWMINCKLRMNSDIRIYIF